MSDHAALEARYGRLLREEGAALRRVARTYEHDATRSEDLFQEICLAIWKALPSFRGESSERTFVFRIAHNRGLTHGFRSRMRKAPVGAGEDLGEAESVPDPRLGPEGSIEQAERRDLLHRAIRALPLLQREVLTLLLEGLTVGEIAEVLGVTENNAAVRLSRARASLRARLLGTGPAGKGGVR